MHKKSSSKRGELKPKFNKILSGIFVFVCVFSMALPAAVHAIPAPGIGNELTPIANDEPKRGYNPETGRLSFLGGGGLLPEQRAGFSTDTSAQERAMEITALYGREFGLGEPSEELDLLNSQTDENGNGIVHYQQVHDSVPVIAGELIVNMNASGQMLSMSGEVSPDLTINTNPSIQAQTATATALSAVAAWHSLDETDLIAATPELWVFDESLLRASTRPVELVWRMEVTAKSTMEPIREMVLVNAHSGEISFHVNQVDAGGEAGSAITRVVDGNEQSPLQTNASQIPYSDLVVDEARGKLYGADQAGNKIDVINMDDLSIASSYLLGNSALPTGIEMSLDGNELAVAQSGFDRIAFIDLGTGIISAMPAALSGAIAPNPVSNPYDVLYGRTGILYVLSDNGLHTLDVTLTPPIESSGQYVALESATKFGAMTSDRNTLFFVTGYAGSPTNRLYKFDVSAGLTKPTSLNFTYLSGTYNTTNVRLSLADDGTLLTSWGSVYDTSNLTLKGKNGQSLSPAIALPGHDFYVTAYDDPSNPDLLHFFDEESSHKLASLSSSVSGTPGAMAVSDSGDTLFVSSSGGMTRFEIGATPPGTVISPPASLHQYQDFVFDVPRGVIYGTDASGRVDVLDQDTGNVLDSYLLPNGADPMGIDLSPDGSELAIALNGLEAVLFIHPETGAEVARVKPLNDDDSNLPFDVIYGRSGRVYSDGNPSSYGFDYLHVYDSVTHSWLGRSPVMVRDGAELSITSDHRYIYANGLGYPEEIYVFDVQTDIPVKLYEESVQGTKFAITLDGGRVFTNNGQVWSRDIQEQLGTLQDISGTLIKYLPVKNAVALTVGNEIMFFGVYDYLLISTYTPPLTGDIHEMEVSPDGSRIIINFSDGSILLLDPSTILPAPPQTPLPSTIRYEDMVVDEARGKLYGADRDGNKIDVIDASDLSVVGSFPLSYSSWPTSIDLSPDGNELAVAQSGLSRVAFVDLINGTISETPSTLGGSNAKASDVLYGRPGILYAISDRGVHVIDTATHVEDLTQYVTGATLGKGFGALTSDKNTLLFITSSDTTASVFLNKVNVSAGLTKPVLLSYAYLYNSGFAKNIRLSLVDDNTLLTTWGSIFDVSNLKLKAKNGQNPFPAIALPGHDFYPVVVDNTNIPDSLSFHDGQSSYQVSSLTTGMMGTPGAMAVTGDGSSLFVSSTGGMTRFHIGGTPPGEAVDLPQSQKQYRDFAFDASREVIYGTDASGRVDVLDQDTGSIIKSYLLPNGANPIGIDLSPDGNELAIALNGLESILFMNPETGAVIASGYPQGTAIYRNILPYDVIYGRTGRLYSNGMDTLQIFDSLTHNLLATKGSSSTGEMILTADKKYIYDNDPPNHIRVYDVQTDNVSTVYQKTYIDAVKHAIIPDGSKVFTSGGQVWNGTLQEQLGLLEGGAGNLIEYIPGQDALVVATQDTDGSLLRFINAATHRLLTTYRPTNPGNIVEMEIAPDGGRLVLNFSNSDILILDISTILPVAPTPPPTGPATILYEDLVVDEARGKLYGADKTGSKIDVINMSDLSVESSHLLIYGALPTGIDLSPDGNELAIAQSGLSRIAFINLNDGTISYTPSNLSGSSTKGYDVIYGRTGILYALSTKGIHVVNTAVFPHVEDATQLAVKDTVEKFGALTSDKNTLFFVSGSSSTGYNALRKYNVSAGLSKPVELGYTYLFNSDFTRNIRLNLADDNTLLTSWGSIYNATTLTLNAKNGQNLLPILALPGRSFYAVAHDNATGSDSLHFFDEQSSHHLSSLNIGVTGTPGIMAATSDGNTLFVSSTGGMTKFGIGVTAPGIPVSLPQSLHQYRDFVFDMPRGVVYGTDASGRVDVIDQATGTIIKSHLLPNGANPIGIDLSPAGDELAIAMNGLEAILFMDPVSGAEIARSTPQISPSIYYANLPYDVIYGRSGRLYSDGNPEAVASGIDYLHVYDSTTHTWLAKSSTALRYGAELAITADKKYIYANETFLPNTIYVLDVQTDAINKLYEGPYGAVVASKFTIMPDGSKVFTSNGQVWSGNMQTQLGTLQGSPGNLIKTIPGNSALALSVGRNINFISAVDYHLISTYISTYAGSILEMEIAPDSSRLIANFADGNILLLDLTSFPPPGPTPLPTFTPGPGPSKTPGPSATPGPSPTPVPPSSTGPRRTYSAAGGTTLPGTFLCDQSQTSCTNGADPDADSAHQFAADTFVFYNAHHSRNSFDNNGSMTISTVNYGIGYQNAFWNGYQMVYGDSMAADDVVGHEITHGVTQYTSNLIYAYQSGAINESFSDLWGEFIDQTNGSGNDSPSVKWLMGEDTPLGAIRSMSNPPAYGDPDKMSSPYYYTGSGDNGGVHINSGVNNKAVYLLVEGGAFNGRSITGIGLNKTAAIYYEVQTNLLTAGANYNDLYYALNQACQNLIGGADGITQNDCNQVRTAAEAVEMVVLPPATPTPTPTDTSTPTPSNTPTNTPTLTPTATNSATATTTATTVPVSVLVSPSGILTNWDHTVRWIGIPNATWYLLEVQTSGNTQVFRKWYTSAQTGCSGGTDCSIALTDINLPNGDYKWRIMDYGAYGYGTNTPFLNFTLNAACYTLTTNTNPAEGGSVTSPAQTCAGGYTAGSIIQLMAVPNPGYLLENWSGDATGTSNPLSVTMDGDKTITANFNAALAPRSPSGTFTTWDKTFAWTGLTNATWYLIEVQTSSGTQVFRKWYTSTQAGCSDGTNCSVTASEVNLPNGDYKWRVMDYGAYGYGTNTPFLNFRLNLTLACYTLTIEVNPGAGGVINASAQNCPGGYISGTSVQLTAIPNTGYNFAGWSGDAGGTSNPTTIIMDGNKTVAANLRGNAPLFPSGTLTSWDKSITWTGLSDATWYLIEVQTASGAQVFRKWYTSTQTDCSGDTNCSVTAAEINLSNGNYKWRVMDYGAYGYGLNSAFQSFTLDLTPACHTLAVNLNPDGSGAINTTSQNCDGGYTTGTVVQLTAAPNTGYLFKDWSGDIDATTNPTYITMDGDKTITANFKVVTVLNSPAGTLTSWDDTFTWTGLSNATWYLLEVYTPGGTQLFRKWYTSAQTGCSGGTACSVTPPEMAGLANGEYKWRILDYGAYGYGTWIPYLNFTLTR